MVLEEGPFRFATHGTLPKTPCSVPLYPDLAPPSRPSVPPKPWTPALFVLPVVMLHLQTPPIVIVIATTKNKISHEDGKEKTLSMTRVMSPVPIRVSSLTQKTRGMLGDWAKIIARFRMQP